MIGWSFHVLDCIIFYKDVKLGALSDTRTLGSPNAAKDFLNKSIVAADDVAFVT